MTIINIYASTTNNRAIPLFTNNYGSGFGVDINIAFCCCTRKMSTPPSKQVQCDYSKQVWQGAKDVILSTKTMMLLVNEGNGNIEGFSTASSQVALDTKQLIVLMFNADDPVFSQQFLFEATKALKTYILNLIKASKVCPLTSENYIIFW